MDGKDDDRFTYKIITQPTFPLILSALGAPLTTSEGNKTWLFSEYCYVRPDRCSEPHYSQVIWRRNLEDWEEKFQRRILQPRAALGVVSKFPAGFPSPKLNRSFRIYHISCYWMNIQVDPTSSNLASAMLNSEIRPRAVVGYGVKIFHPSPPNYVTRSPTGNSTTHNDGGDMNATNLRWYLTMKKAWCNEYMKF